MCSPTSQHQEAMDSPRRSRIENAASLAEIISAVAVVISLVYVASEIQQNTRALQESNAQVVLTLGHSWSDWFRDESFAAAAVVAYEDPSEMTAVQERQVSAWIGRGLDVWESAFSSRQEGLMTDELFDAWDGTYLTSFGPADTSELSYLPLEDFDRDAPRAPVQEVVIVEQGGGGGSADGWLLAALFFILIGGAIRRIWRRRHDELIRIDSPAPIWRSNSELSQ